MLEFSLTLYFPTFAVDANIAAVPPFYASSLFAPNHMCMRSSSTSHVRGGLLLALAMCCAQCDPLYAQGVAAGAADSIRVAVAAAVTIDTAGLHRASQDAQRAAETSKRVEDAVSRVQTRLDYLDGIAKAKAQGDVARAKTRFAISIRVLNETIGQTERLQNSFDLATAVGTAGEAANPIAYGKVKDVVTTLGGQLTGRADNRIGDFTSLLGGLGAAANPVVGGVVALVTTLFSQRINDNLGPGLASARDKMSGMLCAVNNTTTLFGLHQQMMGRLSAYRTRLAGLRASGVEVFAQAATLVGDESTYDAYVLQLQQGNPRIVSKIDLYFKDMTSRLATVTPDQGYPPGYIEAATAVGTARDYVDHYEQLLAEVDAFYAETESFGWNTTTRRSIFPVCPILGDEFETRLTAVRSAAGDAHKSFHSGYTLRRTPPADRQQLFGGQ